MYTAAVLLVFMCLTATTHADHHPPCHSPNMTGHMSVMTMRGEVKAFGAYTYDAMGKKLRFRSNESHSMNASLTLDLLMFFEEGIFYEIDSRNQSCEKKSLQSNLHPLDVPDEAKFSSTVNVGSPTTEGEGLKVNIWTGSIPEVKGSYIMCATMRCLPTSSIFFSESTSFLFSNLDVELEIKDPDLLLVPSYCQGLPLEETPEGTVNSFMNEFM